jgi:uncharacterized protein
LEVEAFERSAAAWAEARADIRAAAIVGSWARDAAREESDLDVVLLTTQPAAYTDHDDWIAGLAPGAGLVRTGNWGPIVEHRLKLPSGLEVEVGVGLPSWADASPVDPGTRRVVRNGIRAIFDPEGLLARLIDAC